MGNTKCLRNCTQDSIPDSVEDSEAIYKQIPFILI
jgi:hypothetical protein